MVDIVDREDFEKLEKKFERLCEILGISDTHLIGSWGRDRSGSFVVRDPDDIDVMRKRIVAAIVANQDGAP